MIPLTQTIIDDNRGDCFRTCVASILELPLDQVPNFVESSDMNKACYDWLKERGLGCVRMYFSDHEDMKHVYFDGDAYPAYCIMSGVSPRPRADGGEKWHAVVGSAWGWGVKMVHDPHPSRDGLVSRKGRWLTFIVKR